MPCGYQYVVALCLAITSGQFHSFEFKAYICPTIYFRPARDSPMQAPSQVLFTKCPMSSPSQNSIRKGLNLPSFPEKDYYVHEPDAVSKVAYDYKSLATSIASAGGTAKWQKTCRFRHWVRMKCCLSHTSMSRLSTSNINLCSYMLASSLHEIHLATFIIVSSHVLYTWDTRGVRPLY